MAVNRIHGTTGDDELVSLVGPERIHGGGGNDRFVFTAGTLGSSMNYDQIDHIIDFRGAGTSGAGEQDVLVLKGFTDSAYAVFDHFGADRVWDSGLGAWKLVENRKLQYYHIIDSDNPINSGYILVQTATDDILTNDDIVFENTAGINVVVDFEDLSPPDTYGGPVEEGYQGFNWNVPTHLSGDDAFALDGAGYPLPSGYTVNGTKLLYTPYGSDPLSITRTDGSDFVFEGFDILSAWDDSEVVDIKGYLDGVLIGSTSLTVSDSTISHVAVSWGLIDQLTIEGDKDHLVMDNFHFQV